MKLQWTKKEACSRWKIQN